MPIIKLENVSYTYPRAAVRALNNISLEINEGEFIAVMGENGAGKTSFCKLLNGLVPHSHGGVLEGSVCVDGKNTARTPVSVLAASAAFVPEESDTQLFTASVRDEAAFGAENLNMPPSEIEFRVTEVLEAAGLSAYADRPPSSLSGGQKQRLAIASALAMNPRVLVLDEPASQLDPAGAREVLAFIARIRKRGGLTVIMATHNSEEAAEFAEKIFVLKQGTPAAFGTSREIFGNEKLMKDNWIRPPDVCALAAYLADRGRPLPFVPITIGEAKTAARQWLGKE